MLKDEVTIIIAAGKGGDGTVKFSGTKKYPTGGNGGKGGDVYLEATTDYQDLGKYSWEEKVKAEDGQPGGVNQQRGQDGNDIVIKVPLITEVYSEDSGNLVLKLDKPGERKLLFEGGEGGLGNYHFRSEGVGSLKKITKGKKGKDLRAKLVMKLQGDIVFIGYPNAGKSSMLNVLTRANVKVASYAFTTLAPHQGRVEGITLIDLPGLIEGTYEGKGLGDSFVKHTEYSKVVAHFLALNSEDILKDYQTMRKELENLSADLAAKPEIIVLTKSDEITPEELKEKLKQLSKIKVEKVVCSIIDDASIENLKEKFVKIVKEN
jgi:GTPase